MRVEKFCGGFVPVPDNATVTKDATTIDITWSSPDTPARRNVVNTVRFRSSGSGIDQKCFARVRMQIPHWKTGTWMNNGKASNNCVTHRVMGDILMGRAL